MVRSRLLQTVLLLTLTALMAPQVHASEPEEKASPENDTPGPLFRLNVSPSGYPPYLIVNEDQTEFSGIIWDVVAMITDRLGYRLEARAVPRKRVDQMLLEGYIDGTARAIEWTPKPDQFVFTQPIVHIREVVFTLAEQRLDFRAGEDLRGTRIVTHLGYRYPMLKPLLDSGDIKRFDVSRDEDLFKYLRLAEEFDAAIADELVGQWIIRKEGWQGKFRHSAVPLSDFGFRLMVRPDMKEFASRFDKELRKLKDNGTLEEVLGRYR